MGRIVVGDDKEGASVSVIVNRRAILVAVKSEQERKKEVYKAWYISVGTACRHFQVLVTVDAVT